MRDDVVGELGVGGHTVVRGWVWPGSQRLANQRQGAWAGAVNQEILPNQRQVRPLRPISTTLDRQKRSGICARGASNELFGRVLTFYTVGVGLRDADWLLGCSK